MEQQPEKAALEELITVYCKAWSEPERALREQLLNRVWADDGTYTDPTAHVVGRKELVEHIGKFFEQFPGARIVPSSVVDAHHEKLRFNWRLVLPDGKVLLEGIDFGELSADGKLRRIVGFLGPLAPRP
jgi:hypothetical protein